MKLKKLEIVGFKSFVDKAVIDFPPGISAVVGPNGCGKSNIVDALRWVMGEQSVKQLRGKSMEDIIFAGADGKPPMNMAEVSLTMHNDNGSAPEELRDFTEIMVTRRLYRSGESAYLLNKRPCRLKDVHNIFYGSGMGPKTYAVIQQGNIGAITDAGPEERRYFIEEAAGVTRYKYRKAEALRKVNATNQNLLRLNDIITEISRQMSGLKRQAQKAERYNRLQQQIKDLDVKLGLHYYHDLGVTIDETAALLQQLQDTDIEQNAELKKLDAAVEDIKLARTRKDQEIAEQKSRKFEAHRQIDRLENDQTHLKDEAKRLGEEVIELEGSAKVLAEKNQDIEQEVFVEKRRNADMTAEAESIDASLQKEREATEDVRKRLEERNRKLDEAKARLMEVVAEEAKYKNIYQNAANTKENLKRRLRRIDEEVVLAQSKTRDIKRRETEANEILEAVKQEIADLAQHITNVRGTLDEKSKALGAQVKTVQALELERGKIRSAHAALKKMDDNYDWYRDGVKAIMKNRDKAGKEAESGEARAALALMAEVIEPEAGFETAVEAVLGESLQYILVPDQAAGHHYVAFLESHQAGRSGFVPVSGLRPLMPNGATGPEAGMRLVEHLAVKQGYENIVEAMLGHVAVTDSLAQAADLWQRNGRFQTIATRDGHVITHQGVVIGGSQDKMAGILAKKHEIRELERQIKALDEKLATARQEQERLEAEVRNLERDLQQLIAKRGDAEREQTEAEKAAYKLGEDLKHARRHMEIVQLEQEQLLGEESDIDEEISQYNAALNEIQQEVRTAQDQVARISTEIETDAGQLETFNQKVMELQLSRTRLSSGLENSNNTLKRLQTFLDDGRKRLEQLGREIDQKRERRVQAAEKIENREHKLSELYTEMEHIAARLENNENAYQSIDADLRQNTNRIQEIQGQREEIHNKIRYLELEQSQRQMKQENIAGRLLEKYHKSVSELQTEISADQGEAAAANAPEGAADIGAQEQELSRLREIVSKIGDVNLGAIKEYEEFRERHDFLAAQRDDLIKAIEDLHKVIRKINKITQERFMETFRAINEKLGEVFPRLFTGGTARLEMTEPDKPLETGVEFMIHPPGKKLTRLSLLSGGEKALSAIAFIFSIFLIRPTSFCLMDEIDAPLDEANVFRFNELLKLIGQQSQIVMITHNKNTMEFADTLFGVTMEKKGVSKVVSVNLERADARPAA